MLQQIIAKVIAGFSATHAWLSARTTELRTAPEGGYTTETVLVTAILAGIAITLGAMLGPAIIARIGKIVADLSR
jgi:hypothetical protein